MEIARFVFLFTLAGIAEIGGGDLVWLSLRTQSELLSLNRSSLYYQPTVGRTENQALSKQVQQLHAQPPYYDWRCITALLRRQGQQLNLT